MNLAELLVPIGDGFYAWREDRIPARSVLALESGRHPTFRLGTTHYVQISNQQGVCGEATVPALGPRKRKPPSQGIARRMLEVLLAAGRAGERLGFGEICERIGLQKCGATRSALEMLHGQHLVKSDGKNRGTVYWAEEEANAGTA